MQMTEREQFEAWWPSVGQTIGKAAAWEAWQAARTTPALPQGDLYTIPDTHRLVPVALLKSSAQETVNPFIRAKLQAIIEDKP